MRTNIRNVAFQVKILQCVKLLHGRLQGVKKINKCVAVGETDKADPPRGKQHMISDSLKGTWEEEAAEQSIGEKVPWLNRLYRRQCDCV